MPLLVLIRGQKINDFRNQGVQPNSQIKNPKAVGQKCLKCHQRQIRSSALMFNFSFDHNYELPLKNTSSKKKGPRKYSLIKVTLQMNEGL